MCHGTHSYPFPLVVHVDIFLNTPPISVVDVAFPLYSRPILIVDVASSPNTRPVLVVGVASFLNTCPIHLECTFIRTTFISLINQLIKFFIEIILGQSMQSICSKDDLSNLDNLSRSCMNSLQC